METNTIKLTQFSHGAGCGCKISPAILESILENGSHIPDDAKLLVGNGTRDDAAVYDIGNGNAVISTTDFFMPIVDDAFDFGRIAAVNAISDVFAMGGTPIMAISILGWPVNEIPALLARDVLEGARAVCRQAGITLAGGHSIDSKEPIFGLAVTGMVSLDRIRTNDSAKPGCHLFLTKGLGVGILSTAEKRGSLKPEHSAIARDSMVRLNNVGAVLSGLEAVRAMTDVTGFGLLGHLVEMCEASGVAAKLSYDRIPVLSNIAEYVEQGAIPGGTNRNWDSYGHKIGVISENQRQILCDPQTSGGLLVAVEPDGVMAYKNIILEAGLPDYASQSIGTLYERGELKHLIEIDAQPSEPTGNI